ncbi:MAG: alanine/ornithine racemase family PLP-dependent enzyme [Pseudomonadota bacterium]
MYMMSPRLEIDLLKITHNAIKLKSLYASKGVGIMGVTKVVCGDPKIAKALVKSGINTLADSRIENIRKMSSAKIKASFVLLRTPLLSQVESVVKFADISFNSELSVINELSKAALKQNIVHKIILMIELGDLREGLLPSDLDSTVIEILQLPGIELIGIGTNLACLFGIKPDQNKMKYLSALAIELEKKFSISLSIISGGNSANYTWFKETCDAGKINNLRLGESIFLGCETLYRKPIPGLFTDAFTLYAEVIESKIKASVPNGEICQDAFGNLPKIKDSGQMRRTILGLGLQDVLVSGLCPKLEVDIIGMTSDHIILNAKQTNLKVGNEVAFDLNYGALLSAMTSPYITKTYK